MTQEQYKKAAKISEAIEQWKHFLFTSEIKIEGIDKEIWLLEKEKKKIEIECEEAYKSIEKLKKEIEAL